VLTAKIKTNLATPSQQRYRVYRMLLLMDMLWHEITLFFVLLYT